MNYFDVDAIWKFTCAGFIAPDIWNTVENGNKCINSTELLLNRGPVICSVYCWFRSWLYDANSGTMKHLVTSQEDWDQLHRHQAVCGTFHQKEVKAVGRVDRSCLQDEAVRGNCWENSVDLSGGKVSPSVSNISCLNLVNCRVYKVEEQLWTQNKEQSSSS